LEGFVKAGFAQVLVVIVALSAVGWPGMARLVRGQVLSLREQQFVEAAWAIGAKPWRVIRRHILPNAMAPIVVSVSMSMGGAIVAEAGLSFMGIGIRPPTPSWGSLIIDNYSFWRSPAAPVLLWLPALIVGAMVAAFNFVGDGLNEALRPD
jgi:peptide/nickel transport system permease protein/oligopeptide transport system permease protein